MLDKLELDMSSRLLQKLFGVPSVDITICSIGIRCWFYLIFMKSHPSQSLMTSNADKISIICIHA